MSGDLYILVSLALFFIGTTGVLLRRNALFVLMSIELQLAAGSLALLSMTIFMVGMALITYFFGFGLKQAQRSVMALGMGTRNIAAVLAAALAIPNADSRIVTMVVMWTLWSVVLAAIAAKIFARQAGGSIVGGEA